MPSALPDSFLLIVLPVVLLASLAGLAGRIRKRRRAVAITTLPALPDDLPQLAWLTPEQRERWRRQAQRFLREKRFVACGGLAEVTDTQRATIAGIAVLLRLQAGAEAEPLFPTVREVLLYPDAFLVPPQPVPVAEGDAFDLVADEPDERIGEHGPGQVVLSWADVEAALAGDPVNVVVHEFAHALDGEDPTTEGAPPMAEHGEWSRVMAAEFARLRRHRRPPVLDAYGAQSPAEFWCVVAEAFFQEPAKLAKHHAELFALLADYFEIAPPVGRASQATTADEH